MQFCELRLDNVIFRLGLSNTRNGARQLVSHKHVTVNGEIVNIPSFTIKIGDEISIRQKSKSLEVISSSLAKNNNVVEWLDWDVNTMTGEAINIPDREQIPENIKEQLIVELYSK